MYRHTIQRKKQIIYEVGHTRENEHMFKDTGGNRQLLNIQEKIILAGLNCETLQSNTANARENENKLMS